MKRRRKDIDPRRIDVARELGHAHRIIQKLAAKVRHYGYADELPPLRIGERVVALNKARSAPAAREAGTRANPDPEE